MTDAAERLLCWFKNHNRDLPFKWQRDLDYETAKKEVAGYFRMKGEAYASDASTDLELDYDLVCRIMDDLEREGKMEAVQ